MSNKSFSQLNPIDRNLRSAITIGMDDGTHVVIRKIHGFELFNTRAYHNYETWSDGYVVSNHAVEVRAEDLDDAVDEFIKAWKAWKAGEELKPSQRNRNTKYRVRASVFDGDEWKYKEVSNQVFDNYKEAEARYNELREQTDDVDERWHVDFGWEYTGTISGNVRRRA